MMFGILAAKELKDVGPPPQHRVDRYEHKLRAPRASRHETERKKYSVRELGVEYLHDGSPLLKRGHMEPCDRARG